MFRLLICLLFSLNASARSLESIFGEPSASYFRRNTMRFLDWIQEREPQVFALAKRDELIFLKRCLNKIDRWSIDLGANQQIQSYSWRIVKAPDSQDFHHHFRCVIDEPLDLLPDSREFLKRAQIEIPKSAEWIGVEWSSKTMRWSLLFRPLVRDGSLVVTSKSQVTVWREVSLKTTDIVGRSFPFPEPKAVSAVFQSEGEGDKLFRLEVHAFHGFWVEDQHRPVVMRVYEEFGTPVRVLYWNSDGFAGASFP